MSSPEALSMALSEIKQKYLGGNVHTIGIGYKNGDPAQGECIVCKVVKKYPLMQLDNSDRIPRTIVVPPTSGSPVNMRHLHTIVPIDVVEAVQNSIKILHIDFGLHDHPPGYDTRAGEQHRQCWDAPIPGGAQIAPRGAGWVGTLGCCFGYTDDNGNRKWGALTNWHVAVGSQFRQGSDMMQPHGSAPTDYFAKLDRWADIKFDGSPNYIDAAVLDTYRNDGPYSPGTHTVDPIQIGLGRLSSEPKLSLSLGERVVKSGRTTGVTRGTVTLIQATTHVNYGNGQVARFDDQYEFRGDFGALSGPGDSGSLIMTENELSPASLLFAGGRDSNGIDTTIGNPISRVIQHFDGRLA